MSKVQKSPTDIWGWKIIGKSQENQRKTLKNIRKSWGNHGKNNRKIIGKHNRKIIGKSKENHRKSLENHRES